jgi:hypothetical protein
MNPFIQTRVGVFAATANKGGPPLISERICAAVCSTLAKDPARSLDPDNWKKIVGAIPQQAHVNSNGGEVTLPWDSAPAALAGLLAPDPLVENAMTAFVSRLPPFPSLNALVIMLDENGWLQISLTAITIEPADAATFFTSSRRATWWRQKTMITYKRDTSRFDKLFGSEKLPSLTMSEPDEAPYYFALAPPKQKDTPLDDVNPKIP